MSSCCCIPFCLSKKSKRDPNVAFHTIPVGGYLRRRWIDCISRQKYSDCNFTDYSAVCSLHFTPKDYRTDTKKRILMPLAVPSIFPRYPTTTNPTTKQNITFRRRRRKCNLQPNGVIDAEAVLNEIESSIDKEANNKTLPENPILNAELDKSKEKIVTVNDNNISKKVDMEVQASIYDPKDKSVLSRENKKLRSKHHRMEQNLKALKKKLAAAQNRLNSLPHYQNFLKVKAAEQSQDARALFLLEQLRNYDKQKPSWSEFTQEKCLMWRLVAPHGYNHVRKRDLLTLPSRCTLERYLRSVQMKDVQQEKQDTTTSESVDVQPVELDVVDLEPDQEIPCSTNRENIFHTVYVENTPTEMYQETQELIPSSQLLTETLHDLASLECCSEENIHAIIVQDTPDQEGNDELNYHPLNATHALTSQEEGLSYVSCLAEPQDPLNTITVQDPVVHQVQNIFLEEEYGAIECLDNPLSNVIQEYAIQIEMIP